MLRFIITTLIIVALICILAYKMIRLCSEHLDLRNKIGVLRIDYEYPSVWGDIDNKETLPTAEYYKVKGLTFEKCQQNDRSDEILENLKAGIIELQNKGCTFITGDCGFLFNYQEYLTSLLETKVAVAVSSLSLLSTLHQIINKNYKILIVTANSTSLEKMLPAIEKFTGVSVCDHRYLIVGAQDVPGFGKAVSEGSEVDVPLARKGILKLVKDSINEHPNIGCILLECTELPVYRASIREMTQLPVYSTVTMVYAYETGFDWMSRLQGL